MGLSVVIPTRSVSNLIPCVQAIRNCGETQCEILIINDGLGPVKLEDGTGGVWDLMMLPGFRPAGLFEGTKPFIYARNCNLAIQAAGQDDVILLNDDALLKTPGGFTAMQKQAEEHPEYGIISAVTNNAGNPAQFRISGGGIPGAGVRGGLLDGLRNEPRTVAFICVLIPRRTIEKVGLLDERFTSYGWEDNDYCRRVREAGLRIGIYDGCFVDHASLNSTFRGGPHIAGDISAGAAIYRAKWGDLN